MNDYLSKPVMPETLLKVIEKQLSRQIEHRAKKPHNEMKNDGEVIFDRESLLDRLGGDIGLCETIQKYFLQDTPNQLFKIKKAIENKDSVALSDSTHSLKGAAANIEAVKLLELVKRLETMASGKQFEEADAIIGETEAAFEEFCQHLENSPIEV